MSQEFIVGLTAILVFGILAQWLSWRFRLPSILVLLLFGFVAGPITGLLNPSEFFGSLLFPIVSLSVAVILFEGGLTLKFKELKSSGKVIMNLLLLGVPITWVLVTASAYYILEFSFALSVLFGAILVVTGPTVILPILRHVRPTGKVNSILKWEGIVNDPIGALLAIIVFEIIIATGFTEATTVAVFGILKAIFFSSLIGAAGALLITLLLKHRLIPEFLQSPAALSMAVGIFTISNLVQHESGLFAVTIMGIILANQSAADVKHIIEFKENLRVLLISILFIILAARLRISDFELLDSSSLIFVGILLLLIRPMAVFLSTIKSQLTIREKIFLSWMAPRGIVAAAVSALFAIELVRNGYPEARVLVPITFLVIIVTIAVYGLSSMPLAKWLKLANPNPQGCIISGAYPLARSIGKVLNTLGYKVIMVDTNWNNIADARMEGLPAYYGSIISKTIQDEIDLDDIGKLLAITPNKEVNSLAALYYSKIFGISEVYQFPIDDKRKHEKEKVSRDLHGQILFGEEFNYFEMIKKFRSGYVVKTTPITEEFTYGKFTGKYGSENIVPLFLVDEDERLKIYTTEEKPEPKAGEIIITLMKENQVQNK